MQTRVMTTRRSAHRLDVTMIHILILSVVVVGGVVGVVVVVVGGVAVVVGGGVAVSVVVDGVFVVGQKSSKFTAEMA